MREFRVELLDHGYLEFIESWGSDERIVEAARMSTGKGFLGWGPKCKLCGATNQDEPCTSGSSDDHEPQAGDEKLLRYLWEHKHATPFEMAGGVFEVQAPILVFRQWHRHRTQSYNEMSARYTPLPDVNYIPTIERLMMGAGSNKQAGTVKDSEVITEAVAKAFRSELVEAYDKDEQLYQWALKRGVPKELARVHLPVGRYSRMRASANLRNWLAFLTLRMDPHAEWEIRQYANAMAEMLGAIFPRTIELFTEVKA